MGYVHQIPDYLVLGLTRGSMYALIALGYTLVYGVLQLINFAHSEVFMSGCFGSYIVVHAVVGDGKALPGNRLNSFPASWTRKNDAPMALIRKASFGAPRCRSGR